MQWKRVACVALGILCAQAAVQVSWHALEEGVLPGTALAAPQAPALDTAHLHGQIRDTGGNPRQGLVVVSTYLGPNITQTISTEDGLYAFDLPALDHYVVTVFPYRRATVGSAEVPVGFLDRWERVNRTTETHLDLDIIVQPGGPILLDAYDPEGSRMFSADYPGTQFFAVYPLGTLPVSDPLHVANHQRPLLWAWEPVSGTEENPAVLMLPSEVATTFTVWGLWTVPEAGTIMLEMDNGGLGFKAVLTEVQTVNVAYEFASTQYRKAQERFDAKVAAGYVFSSTISDWLNQAQAALSVAHGHMEGEDRQAAAVAAYQALTLAIRAKEEIVMEAARQDILNTRRLPVTIRVVDTDAAPLSGVQVAYEQRDHDFILSGNWGGDAVPLGDTPDTLRMVGSLDFYAGIAKDIGFEYVNFPPYPGWGVVQREWPDVSYRLEDGVVLHRLAGRGLGAITLNTIWMAVSARDYPTYLEGKDYPYVKAAALDFITTTVSQYAGKIHLWNLMNEPDSANQLNFTPAQMLDFTGAVVATGKSADPQAVMFVNLSTPGLGFYGGGPGDQSGVNYSTHDYLRQMLGAGVRPDAIGVQFYYGAYIPPLDLATVSDLLDSLAQEFDIPFFISEFEYPTHEEYPGLVNLSSLWGWHQGHTDQAQADWATSIYTLAFSKPHIIGANWSMSYDLPAYRAENGRQGDGYLHRDGLTPRPMANALRDLFHSWTISGTTQTGPDGAVGVEAFAGEYQLTLTAANGAVRQETIHVREGVTNSFSYSFDAGQVLADNRQAATSALARTGSTLAWAANLGKTSGVAEAKVLAAQAQAAFDSGHFWNASLLGQKACQALALTIDGLPDDWAGVSPLYSESATRVQADGRQLRRFYGTLDDSSLVMQFEFDTSTPRRNFLFALDAGADGVVDFDVTASPLSGSTLFFSHAYVGDPALIFTHLIPTIDVVYSSTVEIRIPLADLGNPERVEIRWYREDTGGGAMSGLIDNLGIVAAPPWRAYLPLLSRGN